MSGGDVPDDVAARAQHGAWCPKLCSHACPVLHATGRADAVPWSFHRTLDDLAQGRLGTAGAAPRLVACTGCGACAGPCTIEGQDVPAQVLAGRRAVHAAGDALPAVTDAAADVAAGRSPFGVQMGALRGVGVRASVVLGGCRDEPGVVAAAVRVLAAAGLDVGTAPARGCCGAVLRDLGDEAGADAARAGLPADLATARRIVLLDPHCDPEVRVAHPDTEVIGFVALVAELVAAGDLRLHPVPAVAWHEPCLHRGTAAEGAGRQLLTTLGALVELPGEPHPGCSGAGMGLPLLDPVAADAVATERARSLGERVPVVTGCAGAAAQLRRGGADAHHVALLLAELVDDDPEPVA